MVEKLIQHISFYSIILPIVIGSTSFKAIGRIELLSYILCIFSLFGDLAAYLTALFFQNSYPAIHAYSILEIMLLSYLFKYFLKSTTPILIGIILSLIYTSDVFLLNHWHQINALISSITCLIFILFCLIHFYRMYTQYNDLFFDRLPEFWLSMGVLCYFSGSLFSWLLFEYIQAPNSSLTWAFHNIANILKNILFAIGLWKARIKA